MMMQKMVMLLMFVIFQAGAQQRPIKIVTEDIPNRLAFYAINENEKDYDVMFSITGTNFRQSQGRPRFIRVPAASKVHLKTIILMRGKKPTYQHELVVNDSLSGRALKVPSERIKIPPKKSITVYITDGCVGCDSLVGPLEQSFYQYKTFKLSEHPEIRDQLGNAFSTPLDSILQPIVNLGGRLYTTFENYDQLIDALNKD
jgi:hypothetical protein